MKKLSQKKPRKVPNKMAYYNWQSALLLTLAVVSLTAVAVIWVIAKVESHKQQEVIAVNTANETLDNSTLYNNYINQSLTDFLYQVPPIKFEKIIREVGEYEAEFKDRDFLKKNKDKWVVELMTVVNKDIIADFLAHRQDRDKFAFFRCLDANNNKRYILIYGLYPTMQMASGASKTLDFNLPNSVRVMPEQVSRYLDIIDDYQLSEKVRDYSRSGVREILLAKTNYVERKPTTPVQSQPASASGNNTQSIATSVDTQQTLAVDIQQTPVTANTTLQPKQQNSLIANPAQVKPNQPSKKVQNDVATAASPATSQPVPNAQTQETNKEQANPQVASGGDVANKPTADNLTELIEQLQ